MNPAVFVMFIVKETLRTAVGCFATVVVSLVPFAITVADNGHEKSVTGEIGRTLSTEEVTALDTHIFPDGENLPDGEGSVAAGQSIYQQQCAECHGGIGEGAVAVELAGDRELLATQFPDKGIGVYWPYAPTLFQYIQRAMPPENPGLLSNSELYSLIGYLLYLNGLVPESSKVNRNTLANTHLPNRDGFKDLFLINTGVIK